IGFFLSALLLLVLKAVAHRPELYAEPRPDAPPPWWIRGLLILTCTGVSFAHGSNDGQKGMGLIMLILIGVVPTAYALNRAMPDRDMAPFIATSTQAVEVLERHAAGQTVADPRAAISAYLRTRTLGTELVPALAAVTRDVKTQVAQYG